MRGKFITLEGPEGSGKSTQAERLAARLQAAGVRVRRTREPGGTRTGEMIRGILQHEASGEPVAPVAELLLFEASRAQLVHTVILPALAKGVWVICDRFTDSTTAYQGYGRGLDLNMIRRLNALAIGPAVPDMTLILDVDVERGFRRLATRGQGRSTPEGRDRFERETLAFHRRVRRGYQALARRWPGRCRVIRASGDVQRVEEEIWRVIRDVFGRALGRCAARVPAQP